MSSSTPTLRNTEALTYQPQQQDHQQQHSTPTAPQAQNGRKNQQKNSHQGGRKQKKSSRQTEAAFQPSTTDTCINRHQIIANARILFPGRNLDLITTVHPRTDECFAFLVSPTYFNSQTFYPHVQILRVARGANMEIAMAWLAQIVHTLLHKELRSMVDPTGGIPMYVWTGLD